MMSEKDHAERVARLADGTSPDPDDDRRLVKLYERVGAQPETVGTTDVTVHWERPLSATTRSRRPRK